MAQTSFSRQWRKWMLLMTVLCLRRFVSLPYCASLQLFICRLANCGPKWLHCIESIQKIEMGMWDEMVCENFDDFGSEFQIWTQYHTHWNHSHTHWTQSHTHILSYPPPQEIGIRDQYYGIDDPRSEISVGTAADQATSSTSSTSYPSMEGCLHPKTLIMKFRMLSRWSFDRWVLCYHIVCAIPKIRLEEEDFFQKQRFEDLSNEGCS